MADPPVEVEPRRGLGPDTQVREVGVLLDSQTYRSELLQRPVEGHGSLTAASLDTTVNS